ncbi:Gfo/Idh/MocA family protein [Caldicellulosiruptoraceae bacterium PP1]
MLKIGLIGLGFMGRTHFENYIRLEKEGLPIKLVALCDIDKTKFEDNKVTGNLDVGKGNYDFSNYKLYFDYVKMIEEEELDIIDISLPTYLHADAAIKALDKGINVLCEKPMALNSDECSKMIEASLRNNKKLMIAQCLRFWPAYEYLKECVEDKRFGNVVSAYFFRGGSTPLWSYQNWLLDETKSGGCLLDQHIHDIDIVNWLFGKPQYVSTIAKKIMQGSGYDAISTNYIYSDSKVINAQDDWTLNGDFGFDMIFRVNFERGNIVFEKGKLKVNPNDQQGFYPELDKDNGYYREIRYFIESILNNTVLEKANPYSTMDSIKIAEAEKESADKNGLFVEVK